MMNSLSATAFLPNCSRIHCTKRRRFCSRMPVVFSSLKSSTPSVGLHELSGDDVLQTFFRERKLDGDIIARISDELWLRGANANSLNFEEVSDNQNFNAEQALEEESEGGFLKLKRTSEWLLGDIESAPMHKKMTLKEVADDSEKKKRLNLLRYEAVAWEHEQFSRLRVTAATLSELSVAPDFLESAGGLSDSRYFVDEVAITRSAKLVAESLARHIYGQEGKNIDIFADDSSLSVNPSYIRSWLQFLSTTPRMAPFLSKNDPLIVALKKELEEHTAEVRVQHEVLDGMFTFYNSTSSRLHIYQVASVTFDLLLLLVLGSYLITLFSFLVITTRGLDDLISLFRRPTSRKVKTT